MTGGSGDDTYEIAIELFQDHTAIITDFEAGDMIDIYAPWSNAEIGASDFEQIGDDLVYEDDNITIILQDISSLDVHVSGGVGRLTC